MTGRFCRAAPRAISSPAHGKSWQNPQSQRVRLTPRDDNDTSNDVAMDDTSTGQPDAPSTASADQADTRVRSDQPPSRVRRVYIAPKNAEPFMVEYVSGQVTCTTCGYEPLPVDESGEIKRQPNRRTKVLEKRMKKLAEFGMFGKVNSTLLATSHPYR